MNRDAPSVSNTNPVLFPPCPSIPEESWRKTNPKLFFLLPEEILSPCGGPILGNGSIEQSTWQIESISDISTAKSRLSSLGKELDRDLASWFTEHWETTSLVLISKNRVELFMNPKSGLKFSVTAKTPNLAPSFSDSDICSSLAQRLATIAGQEISIDVTHSDSPHSTLFLANMSGLIQDQSYSAVKITAKPNTRFSLAQVDATATFAHHRSELILEENSKIHQAWLHDSIGSRSDGSLALLERRVTLMQGAELSDAQIFRAVGRSRIISNILFTGEGAKARSAAAIIATRNASIDYEPIQTHQVPATSSNLKVKILADGKAHVAFQGMIDVAKIAVRTSAQQENKNLILSKTARINAAPRLQILPDDVQCKHGSATGEIDPRQLYYLTTRGFTEPEARNLIVQAFAADALSVLQREENSPLVALCERFLR